MEGDVAAAVPIHVEEDRRITLILHRDRFGGSAGESVHDVESLVARRIDVGVNAPKVGSSSGRISGTPRNVPARSPPLEPPGL